MRHDRLAHNQDENETSKSSRRSSARSDHRGRGRSNSTVDLAPGSMPIFQALPPSNQDSTGGPPTSLMPQQSVESDQDYSLHTLPMTGQHVTLQGHYNTGMHNFASNVGHFQQHQLTTLPDAVVPQGTYEESIDYLASFFDSGPYPTYQFSSMIGAQQAMPLFSPDVIPQQPPAIMQQESSGPSLIQSDIDDGASFSRFGSRLPSLQPEESKSDAQDDRRPRTPLSHVSQEDRQDLHMRLLRFAHIIPPHSQLPSRLALSRYISAYINGFHEHLPFLHIHTMSIRTTTVELVLAMAAVGAQYCFEQEEGVRLFRVSQAIANERIRRRDARLASLHRMDDYDDASPTGTMDGYASVAGSSRSAGPLGLPTDPEPLPYPPYDSENLIQTAQALLILMAMATWQKHKEILREALAFQSLLATIVRDDGLNSEPYPDDISWEDWANAESRKRTKFTVFCFFNLHTIVYNIPSLILSSEIHLTLPCNAAEHKATSSTKWREARRRSLPETNFQEALHQLFEPTRPTLIGHHSSLGNYVLIHALVQHIFLLRQVARSSLTGSRDLPPENLEALELALRNWQLGWRRTPESSLDPLNPEGPVAFNSTALLRLAYIRLNVDKPAHALDTRDPVQIAHAFAQSPPVKRTPKLVRAVLHAAHALSIPIKIGIRLVARTQTFIWSIQHSLCSLECAFLLSKWLEALSVPNPVPEISEDERRIGELIKAMLDETEFAVQGDGDFLRNPEIIQKVNAGVMRVWEKIFRGVQTWAIVDVVGSALGIYAKMLEDGPSD